MRIDVLKAREVFDSRGHLTLEVDVTLDDNRFGRFTTPAGKSRGKFEASPLHDNNRRQTLSCAIDKVENEILNALKGKDFDSQESLDNFLIELDGTTDKSRLGANSLLGVSLGFAKACASHSGPLYHYIANITGAKPVMPRPFVNILNGGAHASNGLAFQEFMVVPSGNLDFKESILVIHDIFHSLYNILKRKSYGVSVGDEGGFAPNVGSELEALDLLSTAVQESGHVLGKDAFFALDVAANHFFDGKKYFLNGQPLDSAQLVSHYGWMIKQYPIISIEDPIAEEDWEGWKIATRNLADKIQIVGDDVFVTNSAILAKGIEQGVANAILIKPNQIGTLTETCQAMLLAKKNNYATMISHRSGETEDTFIAHLAVGSGSGQIKTGSLCRSERTAKYNELLRIAEGLAS